MLTENEIASWQEADRILTGLLDLDPKSRNEAVAAQDLSPEVRSCVNQLLRASESGGPLDRTVQLSLFNTPPSGLKGKQFGAWRLGDEIGRGGMALVYQAEREGSSFEQTVAVKLLPRGMSGHERFKIEQQILARLEHPNIARLLDGGVAEDGTPWLAMELVHGQAIDDHCQTLGTRTKVALFLQMVDAVGFAHQHLIIHRDIKPGNVLVDEAGRVRLLDFGIAKLLSQENPTAATRVLTAEFAAPEQFKGQEISTATDVFGLGAVLHALFTGEPPHNRDGLRSTALDGSVIDDDLKNIIRKCLREEPGSRYATAQALGEDLKRWLGNLPVEATSGSRRYRMGKWLKRHRISAIAGAIVLAAIIGAVSAVLWQVRETRIQLQISRSTTDFLVQLFEEADPVVAQGEPTTARQLLARAEMSLSHIDDPQIRDELTVAMARAYFGMGDFEMARALLANELSSGIDQQALNIRLLYARATHSSGDSAAAIEQLESLPSPERASLAVRRTLGRYLSLAAQFERADAELLAAEESLDQSTAPQEKVKTLSAIATNHIWQARYQQAQDVLVQAMELAESHNLKSDQAEIAQMMGQVAEIQGHYENALADFVTARQIYEQVYSPEHSIMIDLAKSEAQALKNLGHHQQAVNRLEDAVVLAERRLGDHPGTVDVLNSLSIALEQLNLEAAIERGLEAEAMMVRLGNAEHPLRANILSNVANFLIALDRLDEAESMSRQAEKILQKTLPADHPVFIHTQFQLARILSRRLQAEDTLEVLLELVPKAMESPGPGNQLTVSIMRDIGRQYLRLNQLEQAIYWLEQAAAAALTFPADSLLRTYVELGLAEAWMMNGNREQAEELAHPHFVRMGSASESPDGQTVFTEALMAYSKGQIEPAAALLLGARQLMASEPDGGLAYQPEVENLAAKLQ